MHNIRIDKSKILSIVRLSAFLIRLGAILVVLNSFIRVIGVPPLRFVVLNSFIRVIRCTN